MVVDENHRCGPLAHSVVEGVGSPDVSSEEPADGDVPVPDEAVFGVEDEEPEHFVGKGRHLLAVDVEDVRSAEDGSVGAIGVADPVAESKGGLDNRSLGEPEALDLHELVDRGFGEGPKASEFVNERAGECHGVALAVARPKQDGEKLRVGTGGSAERSEALPRLLADRPVGDPMALLLRYFPFRRLNQNRACSSR